jgi:hypothetical protein
VALRSINFGCFMGSSPTVTRELSVSLCVFVIIFGYGLIKNGTFVKDILNGIVAFVGLEYP